MRNTAAGTQLFAQVPVKMMSALPELQDSMNGQRLAGHLTDLVRLPHSTTPTTGRLAAPVAADNEGPRLYYLQGGARSIKLLQTFPFNAALL